MRTCGVAFAVNTLFVFLADDDEEHGGFPYHGVSAGSVTVGHIEGKADSIAVDIPEVDRNPEATAVIMIGNVIMAGIVEGAAIVHG